MFDGQGSYMEYLFYCKGGVREHSPLQSNRVVARLRPAHRISGTGWGTVLPPARGSGATLSQETEIIMRRLNVAKILCYGVSTKEVALWTEEKKSQI